MLTGHIDRGNGITGIVDIHKKFTVTFRLRGYSEILQQIPVIWGGTAIYNGFVPPNYNGDSFYGWVLSEPSDDVIDPDVFAGNIYQQISNVREDITCWAVYSNRKIIHDSWEVISQRSRAGTASDYYNVGDMKRIHLEGTVGTLSVNQDVYISIMEFDHNSAIEGSGITFGCFNDINDLEPTTLGDSHYAAYSDSSGSDDGSKWFNMSHYGRVNYGGWASCDLRYDILGSTDVPPIGYGSYPTISSVGYDATPTCATNPVPNTLMSCLPSDLRAVMKPITKYTDNKGNRSNSSSSVTATVDYLPLMSEFEVYGPGYSTKANSYEKNKQTQYEYYSRGKRKTRCIPLNTGYIRCWWLRSPYQNSSSGFCLVDTSQTTNAVSGFSDMSYGISPIMLI